MKLHSYYLCWTFIRKKPICKPLSPLPWKERKKKAQRLETESMLILIKVTNSKSPRCATYLSNKVPVVVSRSPSYQAYQDLVAIAIIVNCVSAILVRFVFLCFCVFSCFLLFSLVFSCFLSSSRAAIPDVVHVLRHRRVNHGESYTLSRHF